MITHFPQSLFLVGVVIRDSYLICKRILSATIAINSEFVGFPFPVSMVYPKILFIVSGLPLLQATSMECLIALSTLDDVVLYFFAMTGYSCFVM